MTEQILLVKVFLKKRNKIWRHLFFSYNLWNYNFDDFFGQSFIYPSYIIWYHPCHQILLSAFVKVVTSKLYSAYSAVRCNCKCEVKFCVMTKQVLVDRNSEKRNTSYPLMVKFGTFYWFLGPLSSLLILQNLALFSQVDQAFCIAQCDHK